MIRVVFLTVVINCCFTIFVSSLPAQTTAGHESAELIPARSDDEVKGAENVQLDSNSSKMHSITSSSADGMVTASAKDKEMVGKDDAGENVAQAARTAENQSRDKVVSDNLEGIQNTGDAQNVMALSDDVIMDALFTNIDTLQDQLEVCEEWLRQQLKHYSHGRLMQQVKVEEAGPATKEYEIEDNEEDDDNDDESIGKEKDHNRADNDEEDPENTKNDDDDEDDNDYDDEDDNDYENNEDIDDAFRAKVKLTSPHPLINEHIRGRRSVSLAPYQDKSLHKAAGVVAQKVVDRLSARLDYLKSSLVQCHLLYRQFGSL